MNKPRNILFLQVDQLAAQYLGCYGDPVCIAPNLSALAARSAVFETAYCNSPLCAPSRASMAAGRLCSDIGAYDNATEFAAQTPTYAHVLRNAGYRTALSGKMHFIGPDQYHGFGERLTPELYPADFSWQPKSCNTGKGDTNDPRVVLVAGAAQHTVQMDYDRLTADQAIAFLTDPGDDPFFLQVSFTHPHDPYLADLDSWQAYDGVAIPAPHPPALDWEDHDAHARRLLQDFGLAGITFSQDQIANARRGYYGAITYVDRLIGEVMAALDQSGHADNTIIVFTSDHGEFLGARGLWMKKHFFEPALRVPLMIAGPGISACRVDGLCSLIDLLPTFASIAGQDISDLSLPGLDLMPAARGDALPSRPVYAEYLAESTLGPLVMVREGRWKLITGTHDPDLLYDLETDPYELTSLATDPAQSSVLADLKALVAERWDLEQLGAAIAHSRAERRLTHAALSKGIARTWSHGEIYGQEVPWYRGTQGYNEWAYAYDPAPGLPPNEHEEV